MFKKICTFTIPDAITVFLNNFVALSKTNELFTWPNDIESEIYALTTRVQKTKLIYDDGS